MQPNWTTRYHKELEAAKLARQQGNEGRARVCARRAVGWAIQTYYQQKNIKLETPSALDHIQHLHNNSKTSPELKKQLSYFLERVQYTRSGERPSLRSETDLIYEAEKIITLLLPSD